LRDKEKRCGFEKMGRMGREPVVSEEGKRPREEEERKERREAHTPLRYSKVSYSSPLLH
jgi:hypothetical protein